MSDINEETDDQKFLRLYRETEKQFLPNEMPTTITRTIFLTYGVGANNQGKLQLTDFPNTNSENYGVIVLAERELEFELPPVEVTEIRATMLAILQKEKDKMMAEHHVKMGALQEKINNLLAIEYKPA